MNLNLAFTASLVLMSLVGYGQNMVNLRGTVTNLEDTDPVEFATVMLLSAEDSSLLQGAVAGANGKWEMSKVERGRTVLLKASFVGYSDSYSPPITVEDGISPIVLRLASASQLLEAVEVTGKALTDLHRLDRQSFKADQYTNAAGGTGSDLVANLPSVAVNGQGEITFRGTTGFVVFIDGRPTQGDPATLLGQLPANAIETVEIITTPGAKYDPDGKGGILNITTKAGARNGWSGAANVNYGFPSVQNYNNKDRQQRHAADLTANYHQAKWNLGLGMDYRRDDNAGRREGYVNTLQNGRLTEFPSDGERSHDRESYSGRINVNYTPNTNNSFQVGLLAGKKTVYRTADILYLNQTRSFHSPVLSSLTAKSFYLGYLDRGGRPVDNERVFDRQTYFNENLRVRRGDFFIASLDYTKKFSGDRQIAVSGLYERTVLGGPTDNLVIPTVGSTDTLQYQFNTNDNPLDGYRFSVDYTSMIGKFSWESGYQFRYLSHPGDFLYLDRDFENGGFTESPLFTNGIVLRRDVHAVYSQLNGRLGKLEVAGGLRLEYFDRSVKLDRPDTTYQLDRVGLYPSLNLRYPLSEGWNLKAGYSRRIDRTTTFKMTPFPEREHNETLEQGDAELLPELTDLVEAGIAGNFGNNSAFANVYFRHTRDVINRVNTIFNDTILNRIYTNVGSANALGLELGLTLYPTDSDWRLSVGGNIFRYMIEGEVFGNAVATGNWVYSINATTDVPLFDFADLQLGVNYLSATVTAQGRDSRFFNPFLNLRKNFPQQRLTVTFQWQNIGLGLWDNNQQRITTSRPDFFTTTNYVYEPDVLRLAVAYQFNGRKEKSTLPKSEFGDREF